MLLICAPAENPFGGGKIRFSIRTDVMFVVAVIRSSRILEGRSPASTVEVLAFLCLCSKATLDKSRRREKHPSNGKAAAHCAPRKLVRSDRTSHLFQRGNGFCGFKGQG